MDLREAAEWLPDLFAWLCDTLEPHTATIVSAAWQAKRYAEEDALRDALRASETGAAGAAVLAYLTGLEGCGQPAQKRANGSPRRPDYSRTRSLDGHLDLPSSTLTVPARLAATAMSGWPSPSMSPTTIEVGAPEVGKSRPARKLPSPRPASTMT